MVASGQTGRADSVSAYVTERPRPRQAAELRTRLWVGPAGGRRLHRPCGAGS